MRCWTMLTDLPPRDAGFARAIASETLRRFGQLEALIRAFVPKPPAPHKAGPAMEILLLGACELLFLRPRPCGGRRRQPAGAGRPQGGAFQAADQRRAAPDFARRRSVPPAQDAARLNTPDWLWERWAARMAKTCARDRSAHRKRRRRYRVEDADAARRRRAAVRLSRRRDASRTGRELPGFRRRLVGAGCGGDLARPSARRCARQARDRSVRRAGRQDDAAGGGGRQGDRGGARTAAAGAGAGKSGSHQSGRDIWCKAMCAISKAARLSCCSMRPARPPARSAAIPICPGSSAVRCDGARPLAYEILEAARPWWSRAACWYLRSARWSAKKAKTRSKPFWRQSRICSRAADGGRNFGHSEWLTPDGDLRTLPCHLSERAAWMGSTRQGCGESSSCHSRPKHSVRNARGRVSSCKSLFSCATWIPFPHAHQRFAFAGDDRSERSEPPKRVGDGEIDLAGVGRQ